MMSSETAAGERNMESVVQHQFAENEQYGSQEGLQAKLDAATERKAAIDANRAELAGQEVAFARAIAAENKHSADSEASRIEREALETKLEAAAERKKALDEARSAKCREEVEHAKRVAERNNQTSVSNDRDEALQQDMEDHEARREAHQKDKAMKAGEAYRRVQEAASERAKVPDGGDI